MNIKSGKAGYCLNSFIHFLLYYKFCVHVQMANHDYFPQYILFKDYLTAPMPV